MAVFITSSHVNSRQSFLVSLIFRLLYWTESPSPDRPEWTAARKVPKTCVNA